jgi:hypothetical protein
MNTPSRQVGWSTEAQLLAQILKQLEYLTKLTTPRTTTTKAP